MSQTYFAEGKNGKNDKIYLIKFIGDLPYFKSEKLWKSYISEVIDKELETQISQNLWNLENEEEENYKLSQLYFGIFLSFTHNILEFHLDKKFISTMMHDLVDTKYKISKEFMEQIDAMIENTNIDENSKFDPEKDIA